MYKFARDTRPLAGIILFLFIPAFALAAPDERTNSEQLERTAQDVSESMMSPFCPGRTISSCPSPQARELRGQILQWLTQGYSADAVKNQLRMIYGEDVKGAPDAEGFGLVGWVAPFIFILVALAAVVLKLRQMKTSNQGLPSATAVKTEIAEQLAQVRKERLSH